MGFPSPLRSLLDTKRFWINYFDGRGSYPELRGCEITLTPNDGFDLFLRIDYDDLVSRSLAVQTPDTARVEIAHDDDAHPSSWALRWDELELICQVASSNDPEFAFPGPLLLLLHPFAPLMAGDEIAHISRIVEQAWRSLGRFEGDELQTQIDRLDTMSPSMEFMTNPDTGSQRLTPNLAMDGPTEVLLHNRDPSTPAGQAVNQYMARVRQVAAEASPDALSDESTGKDLAGRGLVPRPSHSLSLSIPFDDPAWPAHGSAGKMINDTINTVLAGLGIGTCSSSGVRMSASGDLVTADSSLTLVGDRAAALSVVANLLRGFGVPASSSIRDYRSVDPPISLGDIAIDPAVSYLELSRIEVVEIDSPQRHRFDRRVVDDAVWAAARSILLKSVAQVSDTEYQRQLHVTCSDGGQMAVRCKATEYDPTGLIVTIQILSIEAADLIHSIASSANLWILPIMAAPTNTVANSVTTDWPPRQSVDAAGLFALLNAGSPDITAP